VCANQVEQMLLAEIRNWKKEEKEKEAVEGVYHNNEPVSI
jgi:hypothetical protein